MLLEHLFMIVPLSGFMSGQKMGLTGAKEGLFSSECLCGIE